ncbi:hypothetical protein PLICRDRAFT_45358 [Plicaturopsis crispa FD-325 SS-3]|uniref:BTB domain-containing protein n=1 Tax=Plicaturopsis crispa FD-325 SS-3 TaxID=944288 RepID=A0A0C9SS21_PLICR|nr:hypothetical protein PLICRDRAFT_45358 [Plicaturopsis crispa FD-325 SS-3]
MSTADHSKSPKDSTSARFSATDHDIVLISNDRVAFNFYRKNIKVHSVGFLNTDTKDTNPLATSNAEEPSSVVIDTIAVDETSKTLDLLLQFMSRQLPPSLEGLPFVDMVALAEAVNKYGVYSALPACQDRMRSILPEHSLDILAHAVKYGHVDLADYSAPFTIKMPPEEVGEALARLPSLLAVSWACYREQWNVILARASRSLKTLSLGAKTGSCAGCRKSIRAIALELLEGLRSVQAMSDFSCASDDQSFWHSKWCISLKSEIDAVKKFSSFSQHLYPKKQVLDFFNVWRDEYDVVLQSSDGVQFRFSKENLAVHSESFGGANSATCTQDKPEIVSLGESSKALELLLRFMSRLPQPDLSGILFEDLADLAEAVEKYEVYTALVPCRKAMQLAMPDHPLPVMGWAIRHGHLSIADQAAKRAVPLSPDTVRTQLKSFPMEYALALTLYREGWVSALHAAYRQLVKSCSVDCACCRTTAASRISLQLGGDSASLLKIYGICCTVKDSGLCTECKVRVTTWRDEVNKVVQGVPKLSSYL